jgi:hypothetical protein
MAKKPNRISRHARFEMRRRGISESAVQGVIQAPGQVLPSVKGRRVFQSLLGRARRMLLRVVVAEDKNAYHVVTAYKTSNVAKYWRTP